MISFMLQEGILTVGTVSGIFTAFLLNSLKNNIIDPCVEKVAPTHKCTNVDQNNTTPDNTSNKSNSNNSLPNIQFGNQFGGHGKDEVKLKLFLRDFITWLIIIFILYLVWKHLLQPIKDKYGLKLPTHNTQFLPMGIGKNKIPSK